MKVRLKRYFLGVLAVMFFCFSSIQSWASSQPDYPHNQGNNIICWDCHALWNIFDPDSTADDLCLECHDGVQATNVVTHSSVTTSNGHGDWTIECTTCHMPHFQEQFRTYGNGSYIASGNSDTDGITSTTLTFSTSSWTTNELAGLILIPNTASISYNYKIVSNTADTITVIGPMDLDRVGSGGAEFAVVYGGLIRATIETPNSGYRDVRLFNSTGDHSFADGDDVYDGICEACHTLTSHFNNDGTASDQLHLNYGDMSGTDCISCHSHADGFAGGRPAPPHDTQPFLNDCYLCHVDNVAYSVVVPDSKCNQCHTEAGSLRASFDTAPIVLTHSDVHGSGDHTYSLSCVDCHTLMGAPTNLNLVSSRVAGSIVPNTLITYTSRSGAGSMADGAPHESNICETCHTETNHHWNDGLAPADEDPENPGVYIGHYDGMACTACHPHGNAFIFGGSDTCDACHGNPPVNADIGGPDGLVELPSPTGSITAGAHAEHAGSLPGGYGYACTNCHADGMDVDNLVLDDSIQIGFSIFNFSGIGSMYDHQILDLPYTVSGGDGTEVTSGGSMTCSNIYCHSDGTSLNSSWRTPTIYTGPANSSPAWGASGPLACTSCHGYPPAYPDETGNGGGPKSNSHARHDGIGYTCDNCHYDTTRDGITIWDKSKHANGVYDVVAGGTHFAHGADRDIDFDYSYDPGGGKCSNNSCHQYWSYSDNIRWGRNSLTANPNVLYSGTHYQGECGEIIFNGVQQGGWPDHGTPPYYCWIDFGDGTPILEWVDCSQPHTYPDEGPYTVTWMIRDTKGRSFSGVGSDPLPNYKTLPGVNPVFENTDPTPAFSIYIDGQTVTLNDLSVDPDYNTCLHDGGPATIRVVWGDYSTAGNVVEAVQLTDTPTSGHTFTYTYSRTGNVSGLRYYIQDNDPRSWWVVKEPYGNFTLPQNPPVTLVWDDQVGNWVEQ